MATPTVVFVHGDPLMVDYTPGADVAAGDVVITAATPRIAHHDIPSGTKGALAQGGGVYLCPKASGVGTAIPDNTLVYWDPTPKQITATAGALKRFGYTSGASVDAATTQRVVHAPA
jgi:predicted RecA/RadA family phage recombinase